MGDKINKFVDSFNDGLLKAIEKQKIKEDKFNQIRSEAIKITDIRISNWPKDTSVRTIGDLLGYAFPAEGAIKNEPPVIIYNSPNPEWLEYMDDLKGSDVIKKAYKDLKESYFFNKKFEKLKGLGGGQYWFDLFIAYTKGQMKRASENIKDVKSNTHDWVYSEYDAVIKDKMTADGLKISDYPDYILFYAIFLDKNRINNNHSIYIPVDNLAEKRGGLEDDLEEIIKPSNKELRNSDLLYQAFLEAGDDYVGPYTKSFEDPKTPEPAISGTPSTVGLTPSTVGLTPSNVEEGENIKVLPAAGMTPSKIPLIVNIPSDGFVINAKKDLPEFSIFVGSIPIDINSDVLGNDNSDIDVFDNSQTADDEYTEGDFVGKEDNIADMSDYVDAMGFEESPSYTFAPLSIDGYDVREGGSGGGGSSGDTSTDAGGVASTVISKSHSGGYDKYDKATKEQTWKSDQITVVRESTGDIGVQGVMYYASKVIAVTLEQSWISQKEKPHTGKRPNENFRCIEAGSYGVGVKGYTTNSWLRTQFVKFPNTKFANGAISYFSTNPPGQEGICIHAGGHKGHSKGCILVAEDRKSNGNLVSSRKASDYICTLIFRNNIKKIVVINEFNKGGTGLFKN